MGLRDAEDKVVAASRGPAPEILAFHADDYDEARDIGSRIYYPHDLSVLEDSASLGMSLDVLKLGPFTLGWFEYSTAVRIRMPALGVAYHVNVPLHGPLRTAYGNDAVIATPNLAAIYGPEKPLLMEGWGANRRMLSLKIDRRAIENGVTAALGGLPKGPLSFERTLDLSSGWGKEWWTHLQLMADLWKNPDALSRHPLMTGTLSQAVLTGFLLSTCHQLQESEKYFGGKSPSPAMRRAVDFTVYFAGEPITLQDIAEYAGLSPRALQANFRSFFGKTPMSYLREVRLANVYDDLKQADPRDTSVSSVAWRWGFVHLGRFAESYAQRFGELPSATLGRNAGR